MKRIPRQVLLVEDNPGDAELIAAILTQNRYSAITLHVKGRLSDALDFLAENQVDVALLDLGLPDSQGVDAIRKIRSLFPRLPIVVITGNGDENTGVEAVRSGAQDYVFKGLIPEHYLTQMIEYAIHRQESGFRLRQSQQKYKSIVENIGIGVALIDPDRRIIETNSSLNHFFPELDFKRGQTCYNTIQCLCHGRPDFSDCPVTLTFQDGLPHRENSHRGNTTYRLLSSPLKNEKGEVKGVVLLIDDITERISVEARLRQAQKMESLGTLAGGVAHDFNNILTAIQGYTSLATFEVPDESAAMEDLHEILKATKRATDLVKQILTFSHMGECEKQPVRMDLIIKEVLKLLRSTLPAHIEIRNNVLPTPEMIIADPTQIHQIMMNLCSNAAHAMEKTGGTLDIALESLSEDKVMEQGLAEPGPGAYLKLTVKDTGTGIPQRVIESIFDPYFTTKGVGEGTGLGLSVVRGIVMDSGGEIFVSSVEGQGSCFTLFFPVFNEVSLAADHPEETPDVTGTERVLLVDDERAVLVVGTRMLQRQGYQVHQENNGPDALAYIRAHPDTVDLIVSDMTMPRMTGLELAGHLSSLSLDIPMVLMTGFNRMLSPDIVEKAGIRDVINKPLTEKNFLVTIRRILDQSH